MDIKVEIITKHSLEEHSRKKYFYTIYAKYQLTDVAVSATICRKYPVMFSLQIFTENKHHDLPTLTYHVTILKILNSNNMNLRMSTLKSDSQMTRLCKGQLTSYSTTGTYLPAFQILQGFIHHSWY